MPNELPFYWNAKAGRYRRGNRFVSGEEVQRAVDTFLETQGENANAALFELLREGIINVKEAQQSGERLIAIAHVAAAMAGKGGRDQMTNADRGKVGAIVKRELGFWRDRMKSIAAGQPLDGRVKQSFGAFMLSAFNTFDQFDGDEMAKRGFDEEAYVLDDGAHHCKTGALPSCPSVEARGFVKRGTLPKRGGCACRFRCRCGRKRRNSKTGEVRQ